MSSGSDSRGPHRDGDRGHLEQVRAGIASAAPGVLRRHYAAKFVLAIVVVVVLIASVGSANYLAAKETVEDDAAGQLRSTAALQANAVDGWVTNMKTVSRSAAVSEEVRSGDTATIQGYFTALNRRVGMSVLNIHYVDAGTGTVGASTNTELVNQPLSGIDQPWADAGRLGQMPGDSTRIVGDAYTAPMFQGKRVAFVTRVGDQDQYVVVVASLTGQVTGLSQPSDQHDTMVVDRTSGTVQATTSPALANASIGPLDVAEPTFDRLDGTVVGKAPVAGTDWVLVTAVPADRAFAVRQAVGRNVLLVVLTGLVAMLAVGAVLGQQTVRPLVTLREKARRMEGGDLDVDLSTRRQDEIGRLYGAFGAMRDSLREQIKAAEGARQAAEEARQESEAMNRHLVEKADAYSQVMRQCAAGDLTTRMDPDSRNEAMTNIAEEFNAMIEEIEHTAAFLKQFGQDVATASEEVTASSEEVRSTSEEVAESIQTIAQGADRQHDQLQSVQNEASELSATTEEIASLSDEVADLSSRTAETGEAAEEAAAAAVEDMNQVEDEAEQAVAAIQQLEDEMEQIEEVTEFITDVAEQTNVLALNANIEASRAGEAGSGFAVVAEEVKELAEETREAAEEIEDLVASVREQTAHTAEEVQATSEEVARSTDTVEETVAALREIAGYAEDTNEGVQEISDATRDQATSTEKVASMVTDAAGISEETSSQAENVAAAAEEQTSALDEVASSMDQLSGRTVQLQELLDRFETDVEAELEDTLLDDDEEAGPSAGLSSSE